MNPQTVIAVAYLLPPIVVHALQAICFTVWLAWVISDLRRAFKKRGESDQEDRQDWMTAVVVAFLTGGAGSLWLLALYWPYGWFGGIWGLLAVWF